MRPLDPRFQAALDVVTNDLQGAHQAMEASAAVGAAAGGEEEGREKKGEGEK